MSYKSNLLLYTLKYAETCYEFLSAPKDSVCMHPPTRYPIFLSFVIDVLSWLLSDVTTYCN